MRVAILGQYPLDPDRLLGGPEAALLYLQEGLRQFCDLELHIITCIPGLAAAQTAYYDSATIRYLPRGRLGRLTWHLREVRRMLCELEEIQPDIVHGQGCGLYAGAALASRRPAVVTAHGIFGEEAKLYTRWPAKFRGWLDSAYERWIVQRTRHLIAISPYVSRVYDGLIRGNMYLVENPCDPRYFELERHSLPGRLLLPGAVIPRKGVLPLLRALPTILAALPDAHLRVAGATTLHPDYYAACMAEVAQLGLDHAVTFLGHLSQEEMLNEYASATAMVLPSFQETAPIVISQAMACALPIVATDVGGVANMIEDGVSGTILPAPKPPEGEPEALARALIGILSQPERAIEMAQCARAQARARFAPDIVAQRTYEVYHRVLASGGKA